MPLVSVLINNFNYGNYLEYCIESVLKQTYPNVEIILYDDNSTDNSIEIAKRYADRISIICGKEKFSYPSFNQANGIYQAFRKSKGEIICLLDSDDAFVSEKIKKIVEKFEKDQNIVLVQHKFLLIDEKNQTLGKSKKPLMLNIEHLNVVKTIGRLDYMFAQTSALSFRRKYLEATLPLPVDNYYNVWPDVRLTRSAIFFGKIITINEYIAEYRVHKLNDSSKLKDKKLLHSSVQQAYSYFNSLPYNTIQHQLTPGISLYKKMMSMIIILFYYFFMSNNLFQEKVSFVKYFFKKNNV